MANFRGLLNRLKEEYPKPTTRGRPFEKICIWWLKNDPTYADTFKDIWLWYDWPDREKNGFKGETGIDLVGETHTGNLWAIQVKCYIDTQVPLDEIQGFISLSGREEFGVRLLISVGDLSENARIHIKKQDKPVQALFYPELNKSPVDWLDYFVDGEWVTFEGEDIFIKSNEQELRDYRKEIELSLIHI